MNEKRVAVENMFDSIAWRYDFLNHFLSFGIDRSWRKKAIRMILRHCSNPRILDVATGTADMAIMALNHCPATVTGIDISRNMLEIGRKKIKERGLDDKIELMEGDSENIPFTDNVFDAVMVAFGVRNFSDPLKGLSEMCRVVRTGGIVLVLEFSKPQSFLFRMLYYFYFRNILPVFGRLFSKDRSAYTYLPESVMKFPDNEEFLMLMKKAGLYDLKQVKLTGGIASIYTGTKRGVQ